MFDTSDSIVSCLVAAVSGGTVSSNLSVFFITAMVVEATPLNEKVRGRKVDAVDTCWHKAVFAFFSIAFATAALKNSGFFYVGFMNEFGIDRGRASRPSSILSSTIHGSGKPGGEEKYLYQFLLSLAM